MPSKIFSALVSENIETFYNSYMNVSKKAFFDNEKLIHPGEYGRYREKICIELLKMFTPGRISIGDGFIITNTNKVSTQCDLVLYDKLAFSKIETKEKQTFYPIECVVGVIEVKSVLKLDDFKKSLKRLAKIKTLRNEIKSSQISFRKDGLKDKPFDPYNNSSDHIYSALICEKLDFKIKKNINQLYSSDISLHDRHNFVLSIRDGELNYNLSSCKKMENFLSQPLKDIIYDQPKLSKYELKNNFSKANKERRHIKSFLDSFTRRMHENTVMIPEILTYVEGFNLASKRKSKIN